MRNCGAKYAQAVSTQDILRPELHIGFDGFCSSVQRTEAKIRMSNCGAKSAKVVLFKIF